MGGISEILSRAQQRARESALPYQGALLPEEAFLLMRGAPGAKLVDVRSHAEWDLVGIIPGSIQIEWQGYPGWQPNPYFLTALKQQVDPQWLVMFICRSGVRSHHAAAAASQAGYPECYNVLQGFEGDRNKESGQRGKVNGWKAAGLPWQQG
jgi:rhodanese-related sulfurtransferase